MEKEKILFTALSVNELSSLMENSVRNAISDSHLKNHDADELLNTRQAGALINYKASTLYGLVKQNKIPFSKTAGKLLFSRKKYWNGLAQKASLQRKPHPQHNSGLCVTKTLAIAWSMRGSPKACGALWKAVIGGRKAVQAVSPLFGAEQAEVGQWPYLLALCYRYRGFK